MKDANQHLFSLGKKGFITIFSAAAIVTAVASPNLVKAQNIDSKRIVFSDDLDWMKSQVSLTNDQLSIDLSHRFSNYLEEGTIHLESSSSNNVVSVSIKDLTLHIAVKGFGETIIQVTATDQNGKSISDQFKLKVSAKGDINGDGIVTPADVLQIYQVTSGKVKVSDEQLKILDINGDGKVTNDDANLLMSNYVGKKQSTVADQTYLAQLTEINDAPIANEDPYSVQEDQPLTDAESILNNDVDVEGSALTATKVSGPAHGSLTLHPDGTFTYVPDENFNGTDQFTYKANDGEENSQEQTVKITVQAVNDAPIAKDSSLETTEDETANGQLSATDVEEDALTYLLVEDGKKGKVTINPTTGEYTYQPNSNENGTDTFSYKVNDGTVDSEVATVNVTIKAVNDAPIAKEDSYVTSEDTELTVAVTEGILKNDTDIEGNALTATKVSGPAHGSLTLHPDGTFTYVPDENFNGTDQFTYKANDGEENSQEQTVTITVQAVNDAPVVKSSSLVVKEDETANGKLAVTDVDGDALNFLLVEDGKKGKVTINPTTGEYTYQPNSNENGTDTFSYKVNDGTVDSEVATVNVTVKAVNDAPIAKEDSYITSEDTELNVAVTEGVLKNDTDIEGNALTATKVSDPAHGSLTLHPDGTFTYTPDENFNGTDQFTYKANDGEENSPEQTVTIAVQAVNDAPVAKDSSLATTEDETANGQLSATDVEEDALTYLLVEDGKKGKVTINPTTGEYTYQPNSNENGTDTFSYKVNDGTVDSEVATVNVTIKAVNDAPIVKEDSYVTSEDTELTVAVTEGVLKNDVDVDGDTLTVTKISDPTHGTLTLHPDGTFIYVPEENFNGTDQFTYKVNDGTEDSQEQTVKIMVQAVNDAPIAKSGSLEATEDETANGTLSATDIEGDTLTYLLVADGKKGKVTINPATGEYTYQPNPNENGTDTFSYKVNDGTADSEVVTVNVTIQDVNDAPAISNVAIQGKLALGEKVQGVYTYTDIENDPEGASTFKWYKGTKQDGSEKELIADATSREYTIQPEDEDFYLFFEVTAVAAAGAQPNQSFASVSSAKVFAPVPMITLEMDPYRENPTAPLTESELKAMGGTSLVLQIENDQFSDDVTGDDFVLNNAPAGVSILDAMKMDDTVWLFLNYDGTDFDRDITNFSVTTKETATVKGKGMTSNSIVINHSVDEQTALISEYLQGMDISRSAIEVYYPGSGGEVTGYSMEVHQWNMVTGKKNVLSFSIPQIIPGMPYIITNDIFYDAFDLMPIWYINELDQPITRPGLINNAIVLKKDGTVVDTIGDPFFNGPKSILPSGGTMVRQSGLKDGLANYDANQWTIYPADTYQYFGTYE